MAFLSAIPKWENADIVLDLPTSKERFLGCFWVWLVEIDPVSQIEALADKRMMALSATCPIV